MADIVILITGMSMTEGGDVAYSGQALCDGMTSADTPIEWGAEVAPGALAAALNDAVKAAAIAAAEVREYTIGALDKKTLLGAAIDLVL